MTLTETPTRSEPLLDGASAASLSLTEAVVGEEVAETSNGAPASDEMLRQIIDEHVPAMLRVARSIVHDTSLAEDVVQESVVKAWRSIGSYRGESSLRSWLLRITHNTAISTLRKRREDVRDPMVMPEESDRIDYLSPDRSVSGRMMVEELWKALDQLDETTRSIVVLRELEGMAYEDISQTLNLPLPTIKTRLFRARKQLAIALSEWS